MVSICIIKKNPIKNKAPIWGFIFLLLVGIKLCVYYNPNPRSLPFMIAGTPLDIQIGIGAPFK